MQTKELLDLIKPLDGRPQERLLRYIGLLENSKVISHISLTLSDVDILIDSLIENGYEYQDLPLFNTLKKIKEHHSNSETLG